MNPIIVYLAKARYGGWVTFTRHLQEAMRAQGFRAPLRFAGKMMRPVDFGCGLRGLRMEPEALLQDKRPFIIAAADKHHVELATRLIGTGRGYIVVHDPAEKHLAHIPNNRRIVIRRSMHRALPGSHFIPHPYTRHYGDDNAPPKKKRRRAIAHSRIDFDKGTHHILEANDLGAKVEIRGAPNPRYVFFKLKERWPSFKPEPFPKTKEAGVELCATSGAVVDMSVIKGDGGGSQYSFMEAWDAGTPLIISNEWVAGKPQDEMRPGYNCLAASDGSQIAGLLDMLDRDKDMRADLVANGLRSLEAHEPSVIGEQYRALLDAR